MLITISSANYNLIYMSFITTIINELDIDAFSSPFSREITKFLSNFSSLQLNARSSEASSSICMSICKRIFCLSSHIVSAHHIIAEIKHLQLLQKLESQLRNFPVHRIPSHFTTCVPLLLIVCKCFSCFLCGEKSKERFE